MATSTTADLPPDSTVVDHFIIYTQEDVHDILRVLLRSSEASVALGAALLDNSEGTQDSFIRSENILKRILYLELVEKDAGAVNETESRLAQILFLSIEGRISIDNEGLPEFRPTSLDGSIPSLSTAVSEAMLSKAIGQASGEKEMSLSKQVYNSTLGIRSDGEIGGLHNFSRLSAMIRHELTDNKAKIQTAFQNAVEGLSPEDLMAAKAEIEAALATIRSNIGEQEERKSTAENTIANLDVVFKDSLKDMNVVENLPDIGRLLGDDISPGNVEAVFQTILNQYAHNAEQEKQHKQNESVRDGLDVQRTRVDTLIENNMNARTTANERIASLNAFIVQATSEKSTAVSNKREAEQEAQTAQSASVAAQNIYDELSALDSAFNSVMSSETTVDTNALARIGVHTDTSTLKICSETLRTKVQELAALNLTVSSTNSSLTAARSRESSTYSSYQRAITYTSQKRTTYNSTPSHRNGDCNKRVVNEQKQVTLDAYNAAQRSETTAKATYDRAVSTKRAAETNYSNAVSARNAKDLEVTSARTAKETAGSNVQDEIEQKKTQAINDRTDADVEKLAAETVAGNLQIIIDDQQAAIVRYQSSIDQETAQIQELNELKALLETQRDNLVLQEQSAAAEPTQSNGDAPTTSPQQDSAAALQLKNLMEQRQAQTDIADQCTIAIQSLRSQESKRVEDLAKKEEELSDDPGARDMARSEAELTKTAEMEDVVMAAAEQLQATVTAAGYELYGTWAGDQGEERSKGLLRVLVADVKSLCRPVDIRTKGAEQAYEQCLGNEVSDVDIQSVERVTSKLVDGVGDVSNADSSTVLQSVETQVRLEFVNDAEVKPSKCFLLNNCHERDGERISETIKNPSTTVENRLLYESEPVFDGGNNCSEWMLLRHVSESSSTPTEDMVEELAEYAQKDWALLESGSYVIESWLKHKSLALAGIEDLGAVISKFEELYKNPEDTVDVLDIFLEPAPENKNTAAFKVSKWIVERLLNVRSAVVEAQSGVVDSSEQSIVSLVGTVKTHFNAFTQALTKYAIRMVNVEILKRKTAILSGDAAKSDSALSGEVDALDDQIAQQQISIDEAERQIALLNDQYTAAVATAETNARNHELHQTNLNTEIRNVEQNLATKRVALEAAKTAQNATEATILQQLEDTARLQEELDVLKAQRGAVEQEVEAAQDELSSARQELNTAQGKVAELEVRRNSFQEMIAATQAKQTALTEWTQFINAINAHLSSNFASIARRVQLARDYKALHGDVTGMLNLIGDYFPELRADADKNAASQNTIQRLELRRALEQHLVEFPSLDYQQRSVTCVTGLLTIHGTSLSYSEIENQLLSFVTERCERAGLTFGRDGFLAARDNSSLSSLNSASIPEPIRNLIAERVELYFQPYVEGKSVSYSKILDRKFADAKTTLASLQEHCGITKWDVLRAYAQTVEVFLAASLVVDIPVALPGFNLFVTCGKNIHIFQNCSITTSPFVSHQFYNTKARNGESYRSNSAEPCGRRGDEGLDGPAGLNAGHVNLTAYELISWEGQSLNIGACGANGLNGQDGGDGDQGINGRKSKAAKPNDTDGMRDHQVSLGWTYHPACEKSGALSTNPTRLQELSGPGGDGGIPGVGGQGGAGGEIILSDKDHPRIHITPSSAPPKGPGETAAASNGAQVEYRSFVFGDRSLSVGSQHGSDGENGTGIGRGGDGGQPGQKGIEKCYNKDNFCVTTKTETGYISKNYAAGLRQTLSVEYAKQSKYQRIYRDDFSGDWGWGYLTRATSYSEDDFKARKYPWVTADEVNSVSFSQLSRGPAGAPGGAGSGGGGADQERKQRKRATNKNISAEDEYQRQAYQTIQTMQSEEQFSLLNEQYTAEQQALSQQMEALTSQLETTNARRDAEVENVNRLTEKEEELSAKSIAVEQELVTINAVIAKTSSEIVASDKQALSRIIASMQQTAVISQLSQEIFGLEVDENISAEASAKLQSIAAGVQALHLAQQIEIRHEQAQLQQQINALNDSILRTQQLKSQLTNVHAISALDALLLRTESLEKDKTVSQQQRQKSMKVEADLEDDDMSHLIGTSVLLSVRDTFSRSDVDGSIWRSLGDHNAAESVESILGGISQVPEDKRALTVEFLEILIRYYLYTDDLDGLEEALSNPENGDPVAKVVKDAILSIDEQIRSNHWFVGSMTGPALMITSTENITVDDASLTCRYEYIEGVPVFDTLTTLEREAAVVVHELETTGPNLQTIAQFLHNYATRMSEGLNFTSQGYLSILLGNPVRLLDKVSRIILNFFARQDDVLASQNVQLAIGIADNIESIKALIGIYVIVNAMGRVRDIRGGGGYLHLFLANAKSARVAVADGDTASAVLDMRNTVPPPVEGDNSTTAPVQTVTEYGPRTYSALLSAIHSVVVSTNTVEVMTRMNVVVRALASGISVRTRAEIFLVLSRIQGIAFSEQIMNDVLAIPMSACATVAIKRLSILTANGDKMLQTAYQRAATARLDVAFLPSMEKVNRVIEFFKFISPLDGGTPEWAIFQVSGQDTITVSRRPFLTVLEEVEMAYPGRSTSNQSFLSSLNHRGSYESEMETIAFNLAVSSSDAYQNGLWNREDDPHVLRDLVLNAEIDAAPVASFLLPLAIRAKKICISAELLEQFRNTTPTDVAEIRGIVQPSFSEVTSETLSGEAVEDLVSSAVLPLPSEKLQTMWSSMVSSPQQNEHDIGLMIVAILRSDLDEGDRESTESLRQQLLGVTFLHRQWPHHATNLESARSILLESTIAIVKSISGNLISNLDISPTALSPYIREAVEGAISEISDIASSEPNDTEASMHSAKLELLVALSDLVHQNNEAKIEVSHSSLEADRDSGFITEDSKTIQRILMTVKSFVVSDASTAADAVKAAPLAPEMNEDAVRAQLSNFLKTDQSSTSSQLGMAQRIYLTIVSRSEDRCSILLETREVLEVAVACVCAMEGA